VFLFRIRSKDAIHEERYLENWVEAPAASLMMPPTMLGWSTVAPALPPWLSSPRRSAVIKMGWGGAVPAASTTVVGPRHFDGDCDSLLLPNQYDQLLTPSDPGVEKVPLQHRVVLRHDRDDHGWIF
jgi:hypothetical protein